MGKGGGVGFFKGFDGKGFVGHDRKRLEMSVLESPLTTQIFARIDIPRIVDTNFHETLKTNLRDESDRD